MQTITISDLNQQQIQKLTEFKAQGANTSQLVEYALALYSKIDNRLFNLSQTAEQMREIRLGEAEGLDSNVYSKFDAEKMHELRYGLMCSRNDNRDITQYIKYSTEQIKVINNAYNEGIRPAYIKLFDNIKYSAKIMNQLKELVKSGLIRNIDDVPTNPDLSEQQNIDAIEIFKNHINTIDNDVEPFDEDESEGDYFIDEDDLEFDFDEDSDSSDGMGLFS